MKLDSEIGQVAPGAVARSISPRSPARRGATVLLPIAVLVVGWALSGWVFVVLQREAERRQEEFFSERTAEAQAAIRVRMTAYLDALRGGTSFFAATRAVDREDWRVYAASLQLDTRYPGINGLGVIFAVPPDRIEEWRARTQVAGEPELEVRPFPDMLETPGATKYLITYLEGNVGDSLPIGRDIATEPSRRLAADRARDSGEPQLHHRLPGSRDTQRRSGLLLYVPLYAKNAKLDTVAERRAAHLGWIYAQVYPDIFLAGVLGPMGGTLQLHFFEAGGLVRERLLYASAGATETLPEFERVTEMKMAGQTFQLGWQRGPRFPARETSLAGWVAASLGFATLLLAGLVTSLQTIGRRAHAIATARTVELAASEERFRTLSGSAPAGIFEADAAGVNVYVNRRWEELTGWSAGEASGREWRAAVHPNDRARVDAEWQSFTRGEREFRLECRFLRKDGAMRWVACDAVAINGADGRRRGYFGTVVDRTAYHAAEIALRESEERMRLFAEHAPASVAMFDRDMRYLAVSREWTRVYKLSGDIIGRSHYEVFPEIGEDWKAIHRRGLAGAVETSEADLFVRADGSKQWVRWEVRPWFHASGQAGGLMMFTADITERKRLEESLAEARDEALAGSRLKSEFLATMSHEIRTPMNAIIGMTGLLAEARLPEEQAEMIRVVQSSAESLLTIINDILDFSKIEAGKLRLDVADFDLRRVVDETIALFGPRAQGPAITFHSSIMLGGRLLVRGDAGRVRQILTNLLGNAFKFTERGEVAVEAAIVQETSTGVRVRIAVRDTGVGISGEMQTKLFRPFVQAGVAAGHAGGTGLGLAISQQLVHAMGGEIGLHSELGKGSTFWFALELPRVARDPLRPLGSFSNLRVLVVEDDPTDGNLLTRELKKLDVQTEAQRGGPEALACFRQRAAEGAPFHLVIIDWQLPGMTGLELASEIRAMAAQTPLILMTGADMSDPGLASVAGFEAFLQKPVGAEQIERCLLRISREIGPAAPRLPESGSGPASEAPRRRLRLLLVEDNLASQMVGRLLLQKMGFQVDIAVNGEVALAQLAAEKYDAVLMDCQMPVLDGYAATRRIRSGEFASIDPAVPIIAVTAYAMREDRARCLEAGMDDYISKPVRANELRAALERCGLPEGQIEADERVSAPATVPGVINARALEIARGLPGARGPSLLPELIEVYFASEAEVLEALAQQVRAGDFPSLAERAHSLAGEVAGLGGFALRDAALGLEKAARAGEPGAVQAQFSLVRMEAERLNAALRRLNAAKV